MRRETELKPIPRTSPRGHKVKLSKGEKALQENAVYFTNYLSELSKNYDHIGYFFKEQEKTNRLGFNTSFTKDSNQQLINNNLINNKDILNDFKKQFKNWKPLSATNAYRDFKKIAHSYFYHISKTVAWEKYWEEQKIKIATEIINNAIISETKKMKITENVSKKNKRNFEDDTTVVNPSSYVFLNNDKKWDKNHFQDDKEVDKYYDLICASFIYLLLGQCSQKSEKELVSQKEKIILAGKILFTSSEKNFVQLCENKVKEQCSLYYKKLKIGDSLNLSLLSNNLGCDLYCKLLPEEQRNTLMVNYFQKLLKQKLEATRVLMNIIEDLPALNIQEDFGEDFSEKEDNADLAYSSSSNSVFFEESKYKKRVQELINANYSEIKIPVASRPLKRTHQTDIIVKSKEDLSKTAFYSPRSSTTSFSSKGKSVEKTTSIHSLSPSPSPKKKGAEQNSSPRVNVSASGKFSPKKPPGLTAPEIKEEISLVIGEEKQKIKMVVIKNRNQDLSAIGEISIRFFAGSGNETFKAPVDISQTENKL